ncbi:class I SAM-dependent methyltransferase [uncultured Thiodictyon sp.]|uniref:class I SAM-dependent methyltransferase n=1 Tax=uncultured Thiodictyon sp. TaxID=1846217 RepID=UPI0026001B1E|nr:class I SAM-dependent methyltransferase [uncultured Thiodictyon sp.]
MFSIEHLHTLRAHELEQIVAQFPPGANILEIGAGTGAQAQELSRRGFQVTAIDLPQSRYSADRVYPVIDYDGRSLPCADASFDVVFSSNVLEHVPDLAPLQQEIKRVLKPAGYCVHVLPTTSWRFWTSLAAFADAWSRIRPRLHELLPQRWRRGEVSRLHIVWAEVGRDVREPFTPKPHGEIGNAVTELWTFSRTRWVREFRRQGFVVEAAQPMGLFYTGYMVFGARWDLPRRQRLAPWLGSACCIYRLRPAMR